MSKNKSQTTSWKERRRFHAMKLKSKGWKQREIAAALDVSEGAVSRWCKRVEDKGKESLKARPHTGRQPELTHEEKRLIPDFLGYCAEAYGFRGDVIQTYSSFFKQFNKENTHYPMIILLKN